MSKFVDFLRGGHWRGDSDIPEPETKSDEQLDEVDDELKAWLDEVDETLDWSITIYEHASTDFRRRLKELRENAKTLDAEPMVSDQLKVLMHRIEELERILDKETGDVCEFLDQRLKVIEAITGEVYGFEEYDDEADGDATDEDDEVGEIEVGEDFSDLRSDDASTNTTSEESRDDGAKFFSDM